MPRPIVSLFPTTFILPSAFPLTSRSDRKNKNMARSTVCLAIIAALALAAGVFAANPPPKLALNVANKYACPVTVEVMFTKHPKFSHTFPAFNQQTLDTGVIVLNPFDSPDQRNQVSGVAVTAGAGCNPPLQANNFNGLSAKSTIGITINNDGSVNIAA